MLAGERPAVHPAEQCKHALDVTLLVRDGTEQGLVTLVGDALAAVDRRNLEHHGCPLALQLGQQVVDQVAIHRLAIDVLPARVGRADTYAFGRHQQYTVANAQESAALPDELRQAGVTARLAVDLLVDLVHQLEFFLDVLAVCDSLLQAVIDPQRFCNDRHGR